MIIVEPRPKVVTFGDVPGGGVFIFARRLDDVEKTFVAMRVGDADKTPGLLVLSDGPRPAGRSPVWSEAAVRNKPLLLLENVGVELGLPITAGATISGDDGKDLSIVLLQSERAYIVASNESTSFWFDIETGSVVGADYNSLRAAFGRWRVVVDRPGAARQVVCDVVAGAPKP